MKFFFRFFSLLIINELKTSLISCYILYVQLTCYKYRWNAFENLIRCFSKFLSVLTYSGIIKAINYLIVASSAIKLVKRKLELLEKSCKFFQIFNSFKCIKALRMLINALSAIKLVKNKLKLLKKLWFFFIFSFQVFGLLVC